MATHLNDYRSGGTLELYRAVLDLGTLPTFSTHPHPTPPKLINSYVVSMDAMSIQDRLVAGTEVQFPDDYNAWTWLLDLVSSAKATACTEPEQSSGPV